MEKGYKFDHTHAFRQPGTTPEQIIMTNTKFQRDSLVSEFAQAARQVNMRESTHGLKVLDRAPEKVCPDPWP